MTLIEGVGDEVTHFFLFVILVVIGLIAWWSTNTANQPLIRTVLILERRTRHRVAATEPASTPSTATSSLENSIDTGQVEVAGAGSDSQQDLDAGAACQICDKGSASVSATASSSSAINNEQNSEVPETSSPVVDESSSSRENVQSSFSPVVLRRNLTEEGIRPNIPPLEDPQSNILRSRRLAFFQSRQVTLLDSPVTDGDVNSSPDTLGTDDVDISNTTSEGDTCMSVDSNDYGPSPGSIRIRLKYLNDDQKLVEGKLQEQLGDFKR